MWHAWERSAYRILEGEPKGERPLGEHRLKWEDNFKRIIEK
jgi:hypothetical protein